MQEDGFERTAAPTLCSQSKSNDDDVFIPSLASESLMCHFFHLCLRMCRNLVILLLLASECRMRLDSHQRHSEPATWHLCRTKTPQKLRSCCKYEPCLSRPLNTHPWLSDGSLLRADGILTGICTSTRKESHKGQRRPHLQYTRPKLFARNFTSHDHKGNWQRFYIEYSLLKLRITCFAMLGRAVTPKPREISQPLFPTFSPPYYWVSGLDLSQRR